MIKAIVFDCFGVLVTETWLEFKYSHFNHDPALMQQASDLSSQSNSGRISYQEFEEKAAALAGITLQEFQAQIDNTPVSEALFEYIVELKKHYKIGMLSNAAANWLKDLFSEEQLALFDATVLSYDSGVIKPEARAYELIADRLGVASEECVFLDDVERFCTGAKEAGMQAIVYKDFEQAKPELEKILRDSNH